MGEINVGTARGYSARELKRAALSMGIVELLSVCTPHQKTQFEKFFPEGLHALSEERLVTAYDLCRRTVLKNEGTNDEVRA